MKKNKKFLLSCIFAIIIMISVLFTIFIHNKNVLDDIYLNAYLGNFKVYNQIPALKGFNDIHESMSEFENFGSLSIPYKKEYLKENFEIKLIFKEKKNRLMILGNVYLSDTELIIVKISYNYKKKEIILEPIQISVWTKESEVAAQYFDAENINLYLSKYNITREDVKQYVDYILYDVVTKTWCDGKGKNYEKERKKIENCVIINNEFY